MHMSDSDAFSVILEIDKVAHASMRSQFSKEVMFSINLKILTFLFQDSFQSTSLPSGYLVDGLPLVVHTYAAEVYLIMGARVKR